MKEVFCYIFLRACKNTDTLIAADVLKKYFSISVLILVRCFDQGPQFWNGVSEIMAISIASKNLVSTAHIPCSNGFVKAVPKEILHVVHVVNAEFEIPEADLAKTVRAMKSIFNNASSPSLEESAPITTHTGTSPDSSLHVALTIRKDVDKIDINQAVLPQKLEVWEMFSTLGFMHSAVRVTQTTTRSITKTRHSAKNHVE